MEEIWRKFDDRSAQIAQENPRVSQADCRKCAGFRREIERIQVRWEVTKKF